MVEYDARMVCRFVVVYLEVLMVIVSALFMDVYDLDGLCEIGHLLVEG